ncbi:Piso0_002058 [Millerozyma farinosa CBS 7064]|uniref:Histone-lysine N-methyltransferase, H3 lysine-79 specific n=1 Tax=Pichia sorbitophila (strain ATCC MYA-4447 / BCRC 22081 / CBS 7064 / NBRC 10061 / NRRL Y-12695) TaxID=559304 RepID=G8YBK6_PICSO|nr:Piso0_002058 [Millerozyma farinosa CBS 7064]
MHFLVKGPPSPSKLDEANGIMAIGERIPQGSELPDGDSLADMDDFRSKVLPKSTSERNTVKDLTPSSISSDSSDASHTWSDMEEKKLLELIESDLTLDAFKRRLPDRPIHSIRSKIRLSKNTPWTFGEALLMANLALDYSPLDINKIRNEFPFRNIKYLSGKHDRYKKTLKKLGIQTPMNQPVRGLSPRQIAWVLALLNYDLTLTALRKQFTAWEVNEIKVLVREVVPSSWTKGESKFLEQLVTKYVLISEILNELPFRTLENISTNLGRLASNNSSNENINRVISEINSIESQEIEKAKERVDLAKFTHLFKKDLTRKTLEKEFPGVEMNILYEIAKYEGLPEEFSTAELSLLKKESNIKVLVDQLPLRDQLSIEKKLLAFNPNSRRSKFSSKIDELLYTANWYGSDTFVRRPKKSSEGNESASFVPDPQNGSLKKLIEESKYFQSITGDGEVLDLSKKTRDRKRTKKALESFEETKNSRRSNSSLEPKENILNKRKSEEPSPSINHIHKKQKQMNAIRKANALAEERLRKRIEFMEHRRLKKYSPDSIMNDSKVSLIGRDIFKDELKDERVPDLDFKEKPEAIFEEGSVYPLTDNAPADIVSEYCKRYRDLPDSFPPLFAGSADESEASINPFNRLRIRYLLYPQHTELFILACPKSDELDPVSEISTIFQVHYAMYFSHSKVLKHIIHKDYCQNLTTSIRNNDFALFMLTIDKWNELMIELSPTVSSANTDEDINFEVRRFLKQGQKPDLTSEDLDLRVFYEAFDAIENSHIKSEVEHPSLTVADSQRPDANYENGHPKRQRKLKKLDSSDSDLETENRKLPVSRTYGAPKSKTYLSNFFYFVTSKKSISRFCLHSILLRAYSRVVSTDSRKLRSYKAFTAEVYGELLPSFISEVLTQLKIKPNQNYYDLGSGVGNTVFQAAIEFGAKSGGCEIMQHPSKLTQRQASLIQKHLSILGVKELPLEFALFQSFVDNESVSKSVLQCDVLLVNNYLFDAGLNTAVGKLLYGLKPGSKIISLRNFISPRYKATGDKTIFDYLKVEKFEMNENSVSWTGNRVPYYISTVQENICKEYL